MKNPSPVIAIAACLPLGVAAAAPDTEAVEYYNLGLNHYFITATAAEAQLIDSGAEGPGWVRTGRSFQAWLNEANAPATASGVCRFYSRGANSHFYTASIGECDFLKSLEETERMNSLATGTPVTGWQYEGIAFFIEAPAGSRCAPGTTAISRVYNDGFVTGEGSNHRFVDDAALRNLMVDRSWMAEGVVFCAQNKSSGTNANLAPTTTGFSSLAGTWGGMARWKVENESAETRIVAPLELVIADDGALSGTGEGCTFTGQVQAGDGFRSLFTGTLAAAGCTNASFNGDYRRFNVEQFSGAALAVRMKRGEDPDEASIEAVLTSPPGAAEPPAPASFAAVAGDWSGTVGWTALRREGTTETVIVTSNQALALTISPAGVVSGDGFGCTLTGSLMMPGMDERFSGRIDASGCTQEAFNGTYADVKVRRDDGRLEVEFEKETRDAGVTTQAKVEGMLTPDDGAAPPAEPPPLATGLAGTFEGTFVARTDMRDRTNGDDTRTRSSVSSMVQLMIAEDGAVTGSGFGCSFTGTLALADAGSDDIAGSITASGCTDAALDGDYSAEADLEDDNALELEMERETEASGVRTKVKISGKAARTA